MEWEGEGGQCEDFGCVGVNGRVPEGKFDTVLP